jgi:release factor glutamine methyltransferase
MSVNTNVASVLAMGAARLRAGASVDAAASATLDAGLLLAHTLRTTRVRLMSDGARALEPVAVASYLALIERRARGEPLAYLTGIREFWSLPLRVSRAVLVPRPETELLVERALALRAGPEAPRPHTGG